MGKKTARRVRIVSEIERVKTDCGLVAVDSIDAKGTKFKTLMTPASALRLAALLKASLVENAVLPMWGSHPQP